jgi:uncharacterized Zn-binding protein involved in type VI secretion
MPGLVAPIANIGDTTDAENGMYGAVATIPHGLGTVVGSHNVFAGGRPVATVGDTITPHGNFDNPKLPGFNPTCASATVVAPHQSATVFINNLPAAATAPGKQGTMCSCTHYLCFGGTPTVLIGGLT